MSKFVWVQKAKGNEAHTWLGSQGRVKRLFSTRWSSEAEGNEANKFLTNQAERGFWFGFGLREGAGRG